MWGGSVCVSVSVDGWIDDNNSSNNNNTVSSFFKKSNHAMYNTNTPPPITHTHTHTPNSPRPETNHSHPTPHRTHTHPKQPKTYPFSPFLLFPLLLLPYAVVHYNLPAWAVLPPGFLWLAYLHNIKVRALLPSVGWRDGWMD